MSQAVNPAMNDDRWRRIDDLFHHAAALNASERSAFLRAAAGDDAALVQELRTLLRAHDADAPFLETPAHGGVSRLLQLDTNASPVDPIGSRLGAWRITRFLATGGMGAVYLAERDDRAYHKTVAIKLAHRSLLGSSLARRSELERRFEIERQVLANLERWLALVAMDRMPFVLDATTGQRVCRIDQKASGWRSLAFQPGTALLAVAGEDGDAGIWDTQTGACVRRLVHDQPLIAIDFTADAGLLATITGHAAALWDVASGERRWTCAITDASTIGVAISSDGASVAVAADDGRVRLIDGATGELLATMLDQGRRCVNVAFSPDGRLLAADTAGTQLALIHVPSRQVVARLDDATGWIRAVAFHPTQTHPYVLAAAGFDKSLHVWEVPASLAHGASSNPAAAGSVCRLVRSFNAHSAAICAMAFTGGGQRLLSAGLEQGGAALGTDTARLPLAVG